MRIALVYDRVNKIGGAEKIIERLHHLWPEAPLYTSVYNKRTAPWADKIKVIPSFLQKFPPTRKHHEWFFWAMPIVFESFNFDNFDVVISITSAQCKGIVTKPSTLHINYVLTPTKYLYFQKDLHLKKNPLGKLGELILNYLWSKERKWDQIASNRPDQNIAISDYIAKKFKRIYKKKVEKVIYPPVNTSQFKVEHKNIFQKEYYLLVSRLVPSKKVDLAIKAFNQNGKNLVIIGTGSESKFLKKIAKENIFFKNFLSQEELITYYQNCQAFIFPSEEDFGIVMVEALAAGKPVIAYKKGGASEIIKDKENGLLFDQQNVSSIIKSVADSQSYNWNIDLLKKRAQKFNQFKFDQQFKNFVKEAWQMHQKKL